MSETLKNPHSPRRYQILGNMVSPFAWLGKLKKKISGIERGGLVRYYYLTLNDWLLEWVPLTEIVILPVNVISFFFLIEVLLIYNLRVVSDIHTTQ